MISRRFQIIVSIALLIALQFVIGTSGAQAQTRRAVLVGIDKYQAAAEEKAQASSPAIHSSLRRVELKGTSTRLPFGDLDGAVSDMREIAALLLTPRFAFQNQNIHTLENTQATADAILGSIQRYLIDEAKPGDVALFYYAGHGSLMQNKQTREHSGLDSTIVPADWKVNPDIRDKELARLFRQAVKKGVVLTTIFDSCHSGSILRGSWKVREIPADGRYVEDPPDRDAAGKLLPAPEEEGALVLSAAQDYQPATEVSTESGAHGAFTWALLQVLRNPLPNESMSRVFQRVRALVQSRAATQEPVMAGKDRGERDLLGQPVNPNGSVLVAVEKVEGDTIRLQGGWVLRLAEGCELVKVVASGKEEPVRIRITKVPGLNLSEAELISGAPGSVAPGDLFQLDKWVLPNSAVLHINVPQNPPSKERIVAVAKAIADLNLPGLIDDPSETTPDYIVRWNGSEWILAANAPRGEIVRLGADPDVSQISKRLAGPSPKSLFVLLPPPPEAAAKLQFGPGSNLDAIVLEDTPARAHYVLAGRYHNSRLEYCWVMPSGSEEDARKMADEARKRGAKEIPARMPFRSKWIGLFEGERAANTLAAQITDYAMRIARLRAWLEIDMPQGKSTFPYKLAFQEKESRRMLPSDEMRKGEQYKLYLAPDRAALSLLEKQGRMPPQRRIYVFSIDSDGTGKLLFPLSNVENIFPIQKPGEPPAAIPMALSTSDYDFDVTDPLGTDMYIMIASEEALDPDIFNFEGIKRGAPRGGLSQLLFSVGSGKRGSGVPVPTTFSLQRQLIRSIE
jgi:hypothetical protein